MQNQNSVSEIPEPRLSKFLFADTRLAWLWFIIRVYVGFQWLEAGWNKLGNPAWTGAQSGAALKGFLMGALSKTAGPHPDVQGWYAAFLDGFVMQHASFFSKLVVYGEIAVGIALVLGVFAGIAAFFGAFMNMSYLLAGTVSVNPVLFLLQLFLILAWRVAGRIGIDRWLLPYLGTPWHAGTLFNKTNDRP